MQTGDRIKELRKRKNLTQSEMAEKLGMGRANYAHMENNRITISSEYLQSIANILGTSTDFLLGESSKTSRDIKDLKKFLEQAEIMFDGIPMTQEDIAKIQGFMEAIFWEARQNNNNKN
ncbi:hypothetical protein QJ48_04370 [Paenibacillus sp. A3]|uniref:helix-turn-helix domain-containing protein n=1 Tax=Paenibacillus sp. A3 TaxID=1337054 RepID=UPI0006D56ADD|nr:helix-turn-helix transcriptional regulator [Paenibacillus sp. A3]KPV60758.1 hypothetical protein QJ48_04370 [Paenibacillus sp. A3]